jgi:hypothetical protein
MISKVDKRLWIVKIIIFTIYLYIGKGNGKVSLDDLEFLVTKYFTGVAP